MLLPRRRVLLPIRKVSVIVTKEALGVIVQDHHHQQQLVILPTDLSHQQEP